MAFIVSSPRTRIWAIFYRHVMAEAFNCFDRNNISYNTTRVLYRLITVRTAGTHSTWSGCMYRPQISHHLKVVWTKGILYVELYGNKASKVLYADSLTKQKKFFLEDICISGIKQKSNRSYSSIL